jgi:glucose/arabinose dehydrogenase
MRSGRIFLSILTLLATTTIAPLANAATVPTGFTDAVVASGLNNPTAMALAPDGRIFVCQQGGALRVIKNGVLLATPFLTVPVDSTGERGSW